MKVKVKVKIKKINQWGPISLGITPGETSNSSREIKARRPLRRQLRSQNKNSKPQPDRPQPQAKKPQAKKPYKKKPKTKTVVSAKPKTILKPGDVSWEETDSFHNPNGDKPNRFALIHEMVQVLLDARANPDDVANAERNGRQSGNASSRLRGKHFPKSVYPKKSVCSACGYKSVNGKKTRKQTTDFCVKCNKYICKACVEDYHTKSQRK